MNRTTRYCLAGLMMAISVLCFMAFFRFFGPLGNQTENILLVLSVVLFLVGDSLWKSAEDYLETENDELELKRQIEFGKNELTKEKFRGTQIVYEAEQDRKLIDVTRDTSIKSQYTAQVGLTTAENELQSQQQLIEMGAKTGMLGADVAAVNKAQALSHIKVQEDFESAVAQLRAGDILETADQQVIKKLTSDLLEETRKRQQMLDGDDAPDVKKVMIERYDKNIQALEAQIDARQSGLVLSPHQEEVDRITEGSPDVPRHHSEDDEEDKVQLPVKRPRGRPRKNFPE